MSARPEPTPSTDLEAVKAAVNGSVGSDEQGNGTCPVCHKPKLRFRVGDEGRVIVKCHSGTCSGLGDDADWLDQVTGALIAAGVPRTALHWLAHQSAPKSGSAADAATPAPHLPSPRALDAAQDRLLARPTLLRLLSERVGLTTEDAVLAGIGWDEKERRFWLPVYDHDDNLLTIIRRDFRSVMPAGQPKSLIWKGSSGAYLYAPFEVRPTGPVIVAAGERDCLALCALGMNAVCFTNGEGAVPTPERMEPLRDRDLVFAYDNDAGNHATKVASGVLPHVASARIVNWSSDIPQGYDVSDLLDDDKLGLEAVKAALRAATPWTVAEAKEEEASADFDRALQRAIVNERVKEHLAIARADAMFTAPVSDPSLKEMLAKEREPLRFTIDGLHPEGSNALIAAQYKVGKTTLVANLAKSYADGDKFLGNFHMEPGAGRIALFNYELTEDMLLDEYLIPLGIENPDRVAVLNLRGMNFDLRSPAAFDFGVKWLRERGCDALIVDPFGAAARLANENDNSEARNWLLGTLDPFKEAAGIRDLWMPAHTGRGEKEEGAEHVRGASSTDDWADVRWLYSRAKVSDEKGNEVWRRFLGASGRGVDVSEREIRFEKEDRWLFVGDFVSRAKARSEGASVQAVRVAVGMTEPGGAQPGPRSGELLAAMKGDTAVIKAGVKTAIQKGWFQIVNGPNNAKFHVVTELGRAVAGPP